MAKFDLPGHIDRIFDSGDIVVYDVGYYSGCTDPIGHPDRCSPGDPVGSLHQKR